MNKKSLILSGIFTLFAVLSILLLPQTAAAMITALLMVLVVMLFYLKTAKVREHPAPIIAKSQAVDDHPGLEALADALPDALFLLDDSGHLSFFNKAAENTFDAIAIGQNFTTRFRAPELVNAHRKCRETQTTTRIDYLEKMANDRFFNVVFVPFGQNAVLCLFRDRTQTRALEKMRSDFIANASHELRTPLASLRGFIETLRGPAKNDVVARDKFLSIMQEQSERMSRLIDDLLSLSRLEMKSGLDAPEAISLNALLQHVVEALQPLAERLGVSLQLMKPEGEMQVRGKKDDLIQLFQNLIENACKYGQSGKKVEITMKPEQHNILVEVRDYGPGIAEVHIPRLTERFYRINAETSRAHKGTGLGLAIVKHILTHHKGKLTIQSKLGNGASFIVALPKINL